MLYLGHVFHILCRSLTKNETLHRYELTRWGNLEIQDLQQQVKGWQVVVGMCIASYAVCVL